MKETNRPITPRLIKKLVFVFLALILLMGASYVLITGYYGYRYNLATQQRINAEVAQHLIDEKFQDATPFLEDGSVNKALFGDLMHDMMAVNRSIEVYLLSTEGEVRYSVVLDHSGNEQAPRVDLAPINEFIATEGADFILGDDPRAADSQKIFSAAAFDVSGQQGYIYIILAGQEYQAVSGTLLGKYFLKLGVGAMLLSMLFAGLIAILSIWFLTKNLRLAIRTIQRFREGDLNARIRPEHGSDLQVYSAAFNEMADTIVAQMDKMKSVDQLRRELIANVSHDLRTPLAILKGYIETLQIKEESLNPDQRKEYLKITHQNIDRLSHLIQQLFEYSKLEADQVTPVMEPFSITELSMDLIAKFQVLADKKNINLELRDASGNNMVYADVSLVERALQNLVENALKYTEEGGEIFLEIQRQEEEVLIKITDTGQGIPHSEQPYIFERYKQLDKSAKKQGQGLGLAIVKKIMELHNTTITVFSKPSEGSSFSFNLPAYQI